MKQFRSFVKKEFLHIFRDVRTMLLLLAMPVVQLMIFGFAITNEIRNIPFAVLDESKSEVSAKLVEKLKSGKYFDLKTSAVSSSELEKEFQRGLVKMAIVFPAGFANDLQHVGTADIQLIVDASDPNEASTIISYARQVVAQYQGELSDIANLPRLVEAEVKMLYNPQLKSAYNFVPGIMGLILMLICAMMTSISIVREKELGTMEVLLVSPVKPLFVVLSKAVPYFIIAMADVVMILVLSVTALNVPIAGSVFSVLLLSMVFTLSALSLGLLISSITRTQQAAMMISGIGLMIPTILLSGLIFPIENMPLILRILSNIIPAKWFIGAIKDVMIKGLDFTSIWRECSVLVGMMIFLLILSVKRFEPRSKNS
ncbi:MAG: ABC transporter permease [Prevotellaceae bacterium]|jgi:ABC-2 type transport system permease protein|nr:ABC transporter permease [Prevotellaceae bacterium]